MFETFNNNLITQIWNKASLYFEQVAPFVTLVVGILFGFWIIQILVSIVSSALQKEKKHIFMDAPSFAREYESGDHTNDDFDDDDFDYTFDDDETR